MASQLDATQAPRTFDFVFTSANTSISQWYPTGSQTPLDISGLLPVKLICPFSAWTTATVTVQASYNGGTWFNLYDGVTGGEYTLQVANARILTLDPADFAGLKYIRFRSGTSATPVAQANLPITLTLVCIPAGVNVP